MRHYVNLRALSYKNTYLSQHQTQQLQIEWKSKQIESLEKETGKSDNADEIAEELKLLNGELAQKRQKYTGDHPDIVHLKERINVLNNELAAVNNSSVDYYNAKPDNPLYITIKSQVAGVKIVQTARWRSRHCRLPQ